MLSWHPFIRQIGGESYLGGARLSDVVGNRSGRLIPAFDRNAEQPNNQLVAARAYDLAREVVLARGGLIANLERGPGAGLQASACLDERPVGRELDDVSVDGPAGV